MSASDRDHPILTGRAIGKQFDTEIGGKGRRVKAEVRTPETEE